MVAITWAMPTLPLGDMDLARAFDGGTLGFIPSTTNETGALYDTGNGTCLILFPREALEAGFLVRDIEEMESRLKHGGDVP